MRTKLFVLLSVGVLMLTASCSRTVKDDAQSHDESLQLTAYNELFEVYAEVTPPVAGDTCEIVAYFTWLDGFKPLESGAIRISLGSAGQTLEAPTRLGFYKFHLVPTSVGEACLTFDIATSAGTSHLVTPTFTVCDDDHEAQHIAADLKAASSNGVVFTKEMSWKVDFATDSCRRELTADLQAMGLTELNRRLLNCTEQIEQTMGKRNEEKSDVVVGELKAAREKLDGHYRAFIIYLC